MHALPVVQGQGLRVNSVFDGQDNTVNTADASEDSGADDPLDWIPQAEQPQECVVAPWPMAHC